jgi:hypothetical protein
LVRFLNSQRPQLGTVWTPERLTALATHGLSLDRFFIVRVGDEAIACGAVWDQRGFRQTVIRSYSRALAMARPVINAASHILGTPRLPGTGSVLSHAFLCPLAVADGAEDLLLDVVEAAFPLAAGCGFEFLTLALPAKDPRLPALRGRFSTRTWRSRLYRVDWPERLPIELSDAPIHPEVALL